MPARDTWHDGSYRGVRLFIIDSTLQGGRKSAEFQFPGSDEQVVEDLGLRNRSFRVKAVVAERYLPSGEVSQTYEQNRDAVLDALEAPGPATLVHPRYGALPNMAAIDFRLGEPSTSDGSSLIEIEFKLARGSGVNGSLAVQPGIAGVIVGSGTVTISPSVLSQVETAHDAVITAVTEEIASAAFVDPRKPNFLEKAVAKIRDVKATIDNAFDRIEVAAGKVDEWAAKRAEFGEYLTDLVRAPQQLGDSITNLWQTSNAVAASIEGTFRAFEDMFEFGVSDPLTSEASVGAALTGTESQKAAKQYAGTINGAISCMTLSSAYLAAVQIDFTTTDQIDEVSGSLEDEFARVREDLSTPGVMFEKLSATRTEARAFFDGARLSASQISTQYVNPMPARVLAYREYGSTDLGYAIADLAGVRDPSRISGQVRIFSQ